MAAKRIRTYIKGFDEALDGGIPENHAVLVTGPTGAMKSSLAYYMLYHNAKQGVNGLYVSLEQEKGRVVADMTSLGLDITKVEDKLHIFDASDRAFLEEEVSELKELDLGDNMPQEKRDTFMYLFKYLVKRVKESLGSSLW